jgi:hypothetical protein
MAKYLDLLLGASRFHKVEQRGANTFQITAANESVECSAMFDNIVRTAVARAAREGITVREHKDSMHPGREFDFAVITVPESAGVSAKSRRTRPARSSLTACRSIAVGRYIGLG